MALIGSAFVWRQGQGFLMPLYWWKFWQKRTARKLDHLHVVMYTRHGCHLCEVAWEQLAEAQQHWGFHLQAVDVDGDTDLQERYGQEVPVVTVNDRVRFRGRVNPVLLKRLLRAEQRAHRTRKT